MDWIGAGVAALKRSAKEALKAEPIARQSGVPKGSCFWHFKNIAELKEATLDLWQEKGTGQIVKELGKLAPGRRRLKALIATSARDHEFGSQPSELAIRN